MAAQPMTTSDAPFRARLLTHVLDLVRLAAPVVLSRAGMLLMVLVDIVMVGRYGTEDLAYFSLAWALVMFVTITMVGVLLGGLVVPSQAFGAGDWAACGRSWRRAVPYALGVGMVGLVGCLFAEDVLLLVGQTPEMAREAGAVAVIGGYGSPGMALWFATAFFLEGIKRPMPAMVLMIGANLLNLLLNWMLVYGTLGAPEMGAAGSAWATTIARSLMGMALIAYVWWMPGWRRFAVREPAGGRFRDWAEQRRLGYASGLALGVEAGAFEGLTFIAGWIGTSALAAFAITLNVLAVFFMAALGFSIATAVRVGIAWGARRPSEVSFAGWTGLGASTTLMAGFGIVLAATAAFLVPLYTTDPEVIALAVPMVAFCAFVLVFDGGQVVMAGALRGRSDVWIPLLLQTFAYFGVMLPLAYTLAIRLERGPIGLFEAVLIASVISVSLLAARFHLIRRRVPV